jgi:hypothetical protein
MAHITIHLGGRDRLEPAIHKATPMGLLGTEAIVHLGPVSLTGSAAAMRALADACEQAAAMAEDYDTDPDAFNQRQQAGLPDPEQGEAR